MMRTTAGIASGSTSSTVSWSWLTWAEAKGVVGWFDGCTVPPGASRPWGALPTRTGAAYWVVVGNGAGDVVESSASFIASFPAGPWQTNCYLIARKPGEECVIIDPGMDAADGVSELILEHRLKPVAVMLTHGHIDHMFSVTPLCRSYASSCWVHPEDRV